MFYLGVFFFLFIGLLFNFISKARGTSLPRALSPRSPSCPLPVCGCYSHQNQGTEYFYLLIQIDSVSISMKENECALFCVTKFAGLS